MKVSERIACDRLETAAASAAIDEIGKIIREDRGVLVRDAAVLRDAIERLRDRVSGGEP